MAAQEKTTTPQTSEELLSTFPTEHLRLSCVHTAITQALRIANTRLAPMKEEYLGFL